mmetsp:Transcript_18754/g.45273  ORF Transcript_18754/g.45273 Transcript_18754/m.45273 type:complete len:228 (+) Transcript_18754:134-817(+)
MMPETSSVEITATSKDQEMIEAVESRHVEKVKQLLKQYYLKDDDPSPSSPCSLIPALFACFPTPEMRKYANNSMPSNHEILRLLVTEGESLLDVDMQDQDGDTPLHYAVKAEDGDSIAVLLDAGAHTDKVNNRVYTPLLLATSLGYVELVKILVDAGADATIRRPNGFDAYDLACYLSSGKGGTGRLYRKIDESLQDCRQRYAEVTKVLEEHIENKKSPIPRLQTSC